ncbi:MAG: transcriptional regulator [Hyphomonas sp. BRH_c22]|uniref:adenylate/guanylate cyclase domain-containing protein n=1 Tax=Hyphomonas sp. BRH_c22 TaxID=1629710 RepID=UPI0005F212F9|nr:adenylate/guanylate cyclase domain-containing protein [Hyphomonas sp. BRH_c22]KJS34576.1 MAG: transcriptional regulator [Hyphomonas sp. BRH_c22]
MSHTWDAERSKKRIAAAIKAVAKVEIADYKREFSLDSIPINKAYRMNAAHLYADIVNFDDMLNVTDDEGTTCHRRTLRFLNLHYRAVRRVLDRVDMTRVDFHNQRLHAICYKPYGSDEENEADRVHLAVSVAKLIIDVLANTGDDDEKIPNAKVRVGIDTGTALAVNNGRRGGREPLFLGSPANQAAKHAAAGTKAGVFLTNQARKIIGLPEIDDHQAVPLSSGEIAVSQEAAHLDVSVDDIVSEWRDDLEAHPIGTFQFARHTPPLKNLDISNLTPKNSRRQEAVSIYADLDGFSDFVAKNTDDDEGAKAVVRALHVIRSELDASLSSDFEGRRVRFIGDCIHGLICSGTAQTTDEEATVSDATLCVGALRSGFDLALGELAANGVAIDGLGLQIGFDLGPVSVTRLGIRGDQIRCCVGRAVRNSEREQMRCGSDETSIGNSAYEASTSAVRGLFGKNRKIANLDYNEAVEALSSEGDGTAETAKKASLNIASPAVVRASETVIRPHAIKD